MVKESGEVAGEVWGVEVNQVAASRAFVWQFKGNDPFAAVRLSPGAQVTLENVTRTFAPEDANARFAFASDIRVRGVSADAWVGAPGLTESGAYRLPDECVEKPVHQRRTHPYPPRQADTQMRC